MEIDFSKYRVDFSKVSKGPSTSKIHRPNNRHYKKMLRTMRKGLPRV